MSNPRLRPLGRQIKAHWKKHRPQMCAQLEASGHLESAVLAAQELTLDALSEAISQKGMNPDQAREAIYQEWAFLPSEKDSPSLPFDPATLKPPQKLAPQTTA